jgi:hypothetical protein
MAKKGIKLDSNALGNRGESIFEAQVLTLHDGQPLFRPVALGQKWPVADFAVELADKPGCFFLVQVKATQKPIKKIKKKNRLPLDVKSDRIKLLVGSPIPAYLVAVHDKSMKAFLVAPRIPKHIHHIATTSSLGDKKVRDKLYQEVASFWAGITSFSTANSLFAD